MNRFNKALIILTVSFLGLWGCAEGPVNTSAQANKIKALEDKCTKLEEDYRMKAVDLDQTRKQVAGLKQDKTLLEEQRGRLQNEIDQLRLVVRERDRLRQELEVKTAQRDSLQARCDKLRTGIKSLMSEDDAMLTPPPGSTPTLTTTLGGR